MRMHPLRLCLLAALAPAACHRAPPPPPGPAAGGAPRGAPAALPPLPLHAVVANGTELRYFEAGSGIPVVFVHGSLGTVNDWRAQVDTFARNYRVIAYSRRYHPPNPQRPDGRGYSIALHADDLAALLDRLGVERAHIIGSSYGAYVALAFALQHPEKVRSLVLGEPAILPWLLRTPEGDSIRRAFDRTALGPARAAFAHGDSAEALRRFIQGVRGPGAGGAGGAVDAVPLRQAFEFRLEMLADPDVYMPALSCRDVGGIRSPVLLVSGERSARMFHVITEELERCLQTEEVVTIPGAGHAMHAASPRYYNAVVLAFLARN